MSLEINGNKIAANYTANSQITIYGGANYYGFSGEFKFKHNNEF